MSAATYVILSPWQQTGLIFDAIELIRTMIMILIRSLLCFTESNLKILERNKINFCDARFSSRVSNTPQHTQQLTQTCFTLSTPASLSVCKFSAHYPQKISCSVMRIKQLILDRNLSDEKQNSPSLFTRKI